jgi:hypothetical protein
MTIDTVSHASVAPHGPDPCVDDLSSCVWRGHQDRRRLLPKSQELER